MELWSKHSYHPRPVRHATYEQNWALLREPPRHPSPDAPEPSTAREYGLALAGIIATLRIAVSVWSSG